jgi:DNA-binding transcriptional regulator YdaS (Cro superfamily)
MHENETVAAPIQSGIADAVATAGSQDQLAAQLGVTQQAVSVWVTQGWAPRKRAVEIECLTGIPRARLVDPKILDLVDTGSGL